MDPCSALADRLLQEPTLQPLAAADVEQYGFYELADAVAVRCGASVDPDELTDAELRAQWTKRALEGEAMSEPFVAGRLPYWIVDNGERIGTIAFAALPAHVPSLEISSVYVRPKFRRRGWASRILQTLKEAAFEVDFRRAILQVEWNNQDALQFYCAQGMWVSGWKKSIELYFAKDQHGWQVETDENEARFKVGGRVAAVAHKDGAYLGWSVKKSADKRVLEQTAALQLALLRWPIIRSEKLWQEQVNKGWSDDGPFEGFALRLRQMERHIRRKHWNLPRERNPSFAQLPQLRAASARGADLAVALSDGRELSVPFETLGISETASQTLQSVQVVEDEVICTLQSGTPLILNIDYLMFLTQSPEHLARATQLAREASARTG
jgi:ribosomal protein S18 acetylase RimI-like enzyme